MTANLLTPPLVEPVSLPDMKAYLKLDHDLEDELLRAFISAARVHLEHISGCHLISQSWRVLLDGPLDDRFQLPLQPVGAITSAAIMSEDGDLVSLATESFSIRQTKGPAIISNLGGLSLARHQRLQLDVETGFGPTEQDVPAPMRLATKLIVAEWHERRLIADPGKLPSLAQALGPLVGPYKSIRL